MADVHLRKYGVEAVIPFSLYKIDGTALKTDAVSASGDITLIRDEAAQETLDADACVDEGHSYSLTLSAAEMQCKHLIVHIVDQTNPQTWLDKTLIIETYGNASAQHVFDLGTATQAVNVTQIGGVAQSATDLKDFADTGYDPATHKVQGVVLTDTATTVTNDVNLTDATEAQIDAIETDTNEIQGKLPTNKIMGSSDVDNHDTDIDSILADTNEIQGKLPTNKIMGSSDVDNHDTDIDSILADTNELQTDLHDGGRLDLLVDAILADSNELQTEWHDGGRLDLIIDALALEATVAALNDISADNVWDEVMDVAGPANAKSAREILNVVASAVAGKCSGNELGTPTFRNLGDTKNRITSTVDANNNRTAVTQDGT